MVQADQPVKGTRVACLLPERDFDPSEAAVSWRVLTSRGHEVGFVTPRGVPATCDPIMISGEGLDPWGRVPGLQKLRLFGLVLRANRDAREAYAAMIQDPAYLQPAAYDGVRDGDFDALLLPGGHRADGMHEYLESAALQRIVASAFDAGKPVGAICHGVLLAARSISPATQRSVLYGRKTTALTWRLESQAWNLARVTRWWDPNYYRTYTEAPSQTPGYNSVQAEVTRLLADPGDFLEPLPSDPEYRRKTSGLSRDTATDARPAFVVRDGSYVSGRWPGDAFTFAATFAAVLE
jgi:putative intracellular protease/amidase